MHIPSTMLCSKLILATLAFVDVSFAAPSGPTVITIELCSGALGYGCVTIPVPSDTCINFTGGLSFYNKEMTTVVVPSGFVCTLCQAFGCVNDGQDGHDVVILPAGTWNMCYVQGINGAHNFKDLTSSISCSAYCYGRPDCPSNRFSQTPRQC
ncbi:hypothetical protein C8R44DRAFT_919365 [Mycena epipterygia]|nr:hypothetical protein C8R44DRAFT_919365 [Mycena epipterygia]